MDETPCKLVSPKKGEAMAKIADLPTQHLIDNTEDVSGVGTSLVSADPFQSLC